MKVLRGVWSSPAPGHNVVQGEGVKWKMEVAAQANPFLPTVEIMLNVLAKRRQVRRPDWDIPTSDYVSPGQSWKPGLPWPVRLAENPVGKEPLVNEALSQRR